MLIGERLKILSEKRQTCNVWSVSWGVNRELCEIINETRQIFNVRSESWGVNRNLCGIMMVSTGRFGSGAWTLIRYPRNAT